MAASAARQEDKPFHSQTRHVRSKNGRSSQPFLHGQPILAASTQSLRREAAPEASPRANMGRAGVISLALFALADAKEVGPADKPGNGAKNAPKS
eukprot:2777358-Prymnesium_polylepis.1